jgi:hypothetical protein
MTCIQEDHFLARKDPVMKQYAFLFVLTLSAAGASARAGTPTFVQTHGRLSVQGTQLVDARRKPIVLRGVSFGWHVWWPQFWNATHKKWLRDRGDSALKKGLPIFVSEYGGCESSGNGPLNMAEWKSWIDWMEARKISWCKWSVSDKNETCSVLVPRARATGGWSRADLKPSGVHCRELLRKLNP